MSKQDQSRELHHVSLDFFPEIIIVIPSYDEGDIFPVLETITASFQYHPIPCLVLVVVNAPIDASENIIQNNQVTKQTVLAHQKSNEHQNNIVFKCLEEESLPIKDAGVGLARKIGMDVATIIFRENEKEGIIVCLDADSLVLPNYLYSIYSSFTENKQWDAASIHFEHSLSIDKFDESIIQAIVKYELHLRVFINFQKWLGLPYAIQTIGSSMAVKATSYCKYGGMNKRKAGEDFYFLQKIADKGLVGKINSTTVIPSPRISNRVPFGTGRAIGGKIDRGVDIMTYNPETFKILLPLVSNLQAIYDSGWEPVSTELHDVVVSFFEEQKIEIFLDECRKNTSSFFSFRKRFFQWFNAFKLMKFCHYCRDNGWNDVEPLLAFQKWNQLIETPMTLATSENMTAALLNLREWDRTN